VNDGAKPIVLITGAAGNIGRSLASALANAYQVVGFDRGGGEADFPLFDVDLTDDQAVERSFAEFRRRFGPRIASVVHLVAYFDFTGEDDPRYRTINVDGTRRLLRALDGFEVEQFVYSSTILVHAPCRPGERIDESWPIDPRWAYPRSKAEAEAVIRAEHGRIPYVLLRLAGVYDAESAVPTLAQQIARVYEREFQSYLYSGSTLVGQSMLHRDDMLDAFRRTIDRRRELPPDAEILIGEPEAIGYDALQDDIGYLIHGVEDWPTLRVPKSIAAAGAWAQEKLEPVIPDAIDEGEPPFVKPFMVWMADDHYALDVTRAREQLGWTPKHRLKDELPKLVASLKADPAAWYKRNKIPAPPWLETARAIGAHPERLRADYEARRRREHGDNRWAHFLNIGLGTWLLTSPPLLGLDDPRIAASDVMAGAALVVVAALALSWRATWSRWAAAGIGFWLLFAPLIFWTESAAAYLNDTLVGALVIGLAVCTRPEPGPSPISAMTGPATPPGWSYNPSEWTQRLPIIALALVGLYVSRYLAAYQLGHVETVWEPFFAGSPADPQNGTEEIITSHVAEAWPISDAGLGGITYVLEIVTGIIGLRARWRTMPWLVFLFGMMIAPLSITSISFIIIQPVIIGTWSTLALIGAAAMLIQIPYSLDELLATLQFLRRRAKAGQNWLRVFFVGDTDTDARGRVAPAEDEFERSPREIVRDMVGGGVGLPWNLALAAAVGVWLMFTRPTLGADGAMANVDHVVGALALTVISVAAAEVARSVRFLNVPLGLTLIAAPFIVETGTPSLINSLVCGAALIVLSVRRGPIRQRYGSWDA
jgi:nucleoside-diphosphate-sugar epimerase